MISLYFSIFSNSVVQCEWSPWINGPCSKTCGGGTFSKKRFKIQQEVGTSCTGEPTSEEECNKDECPSKLDDNSRRIPECIEINAI